MLEQAHWMRPMCAHVPSFNKDSSENFPEHLTFPSTKKQGTTKERFWIICWICPGSDAQVRKQSLQHPCWCFQGLQWVHWTRSLLAFQHPQIMHSKHLLARSERRRVINLVSLCVCVSFPTSPRTKAGIEPIFDLHCSQAHWSQLLPSLDIPARTYLALTQCLHPPAPIESEKSKVAQTAVQLQISSKDRGCK